MSALAWSTERKKVLSDRVHHQSEARRLCVTIGSGGGGISHAQLCMVRAGVRVSGPSELYV